MLYSHQLMGSLVFGALGSAFMLTPGVSAQTGAERTLPSGHLRETRTERVTLSKGDLARMLAAGKSPTLDPATGDLIRQTIHDRLPAGWILEAPQSGDQVRTDSMGRPIVNDTPGLPAWSEADVQGLRQAVSAWRDRVSKAQAAGLDSVEAEGVLGNYIGQAVSRSINIDDIIDIDASTVINEHLAGVVLDYLHFYENIRFANQELFGYLYARTAYSDRVRGFVERHGASLDALQTIEPMGGMEGRGGVPSGCYARTTLTRGLTLLSGQTDIWVANGLDDGQADVPTGLPMFFFYDCEDQDNNDHVRVSTNGYITFFQQGGGSLVGTDFGNDPISATSDPDGFAAPWWDDLVVAANQGNTDRVSYKTEGSIDQRVFTVEWFSISRLGGLATDFHFFQVKLYETSDVVELQISNDWSTDTSDDATCGIENFGGTGGDCGPNCLNTNNPPPPNNYRFTPSPRPTNDACATASVVVNGASVEGSLHRALPDTVAGCGDTTNRDVWYTYTATCNGTVTVDTCGSRELGGLGVDTVIGAYSSCPPLPANLLACNDDAAAAGCHANDSLITFPVITGQQYWIRVTHFGDLATRMGNGRFLLHLNLTAGTPPTNNSCASATTILNHNTLIGNLLCASNDGSGDCGSSETNPDVWYRFVAPTGGRLTISGCGSRNNAGPDTGPDTAISIHSGCPGEISNQIACNDDGFIPGCNTLDSQVSAILTPGQAVRIRVTHFGSNAFRVGNGTFAIHAEFVCIADFNHNGVVNSQDFFDFLGAFFANQPSADVNLDGNVNSQDFFDFVTAFFGGC